jgi:hypothetical protein
MSTSKINKPTSPAWLIAIDPHGRQERSEAFFSNGMDQRETADKRDMEATSKPRMAHSSKRSAHQPHLRRSD